MEKRTKLSTEDHRSLLIFHNRREQARLEFEIRSLEFDAECARVTTEYRIDHEKENVDLSTGEIVKKEQANVEQGQ
jgi:hypothetical protein